MRWVRDNQLSEPFRTWIEQNVAIPADATIFPRTVNVTASVLVVALATMGCVGIGVPLVTIVIPATNGPGDWTIVWFIVKVLIGFLIWTYFRLVQAISLNRDQKAGILRKGIFVGKAGILVRLAPNRCYPVPAGRIVRTEEWSGPGTEGSDYLRIVTLDGSIDIPNREIRASAVELNQAVAKICSRERKLP